MYVTFTNDMIDASKPIEDEDRWQIKYAFLKNFPVVNSRIYFKFQSCEYF